MTVVTSPPCPPAHRRRAHPNRRTTDRRGSRGRAARAGQHPGTVLAAALDRDGQGPRGTGPGRRPDHRRFTWFRRVQGQAWRHPRPDRASSTAPPCANWSGSTTCPATATRSTPATYSTAEQARPEAGTQREQGSAKPARSSTRSSPATRSSRSPGATGFKVAPCWQPTDGPRPTRSTPASRAGRPGAGQAQAASKKKNNTFAGRTYADNVVAAADKNRATLRRRKLPTAAQCGR